MGGEARPQGGPGQYCGKPKVKHVPFSGPRAPWLCHYLSSRPGYYGNSKVPESLGFPSLEVPVPFLVGPLPVSLPVPQGLSFSLPV